MLNRHPALRVITMHYSVLLLFEMIFWRSGCFFVKGSIALQESRKSTLMVDVSLRNDSSARDYSEGSYRNIVRTGTPLSHFSGASQMSTNAILGMSFLVEDPSVSHKMSYEPIHDTFHPQIASLQCLKYSQEY